MTTYKLTVIVYGIQEIEEWKVKIWKGILFLKAFNDSIFIASRLIIA